MLKSLFSIVVIVILLSISDDEYISFYNRFDNVIPYAYIEPHLMVLEIPVLGISNKIYNYDSKQNDVDKNVMLLKSDLPDLKNGNLALASHNGTADVAFFKNLNELVLGDEIYIIYNEQSYLYIVSDIYEVEKNGSVVIKKNNTTTISLITCINNSNKQLVVIGNLSNM